MFLTIFIGIAATQTIHPKYISFHSHSPISFHLNLILNSPRDSGEKKFNFESLVAFGQGQRMTLTFDTHLTS